MTLPRHDKPPANEAGATSRDRCITLLLTALDDCAKLIATERGIAACDGRNEDAPCEIGSVHTATAGLAYALGDLMVAPTNDAAMKSAAELGKLVDAIVDMHKLPGAERADDDGDANRQSR